MQRAKLLVEIVLLLGVIALAVVFGTEYEAPIGPCRDIEELWAIEDEREESEEPLVTCLVRDGAPLAYDRETNTFYCTLGLQQETDWPELHIYEPNAPRDITLCFADDYAYDDCRDAVRLGMSYQVMAYTNKQYAYFNIVFTGLPIVTMYVDEELNYEEQTKASVAVCAYGEEPLISSALIHYRGGGSRSMEKKSYKIKLVRGNGKTKGVVCNIPTLGQMDAFNLIAGYNDIFLLRDRLNWRLYDELCGAWSRLPARKTSYAELFVNDRYLGLYEMLQPYDLSAELSAAGCPYDSVYKAHWKMVKPNDRPCIENEMVKDFYYELYYGPEIDPSSMLSDYRLLDTIEDDETFLALAEKCLDMDSFLRYALFLQLSGLKDNIINNLYIWVHQTNDGEVYSFYPWDLDTSWGVKTTAEDWIYYPVCDRMLRLSEATRERYLALWKEMREGAANYQNIEAIALELTGALNDSGAWTREAAMWNKDESGMESMQIQEYAAVRLPFLDETMERIAQGDIDFLRESSYDKYIATE